MSYLDEANSMIILKELRDDCPEYELLLALGRRMDPEEDRGLICIACREVDVTHGRYVFAEALLVAGGELDVQIPHDLILAILGKGKKDTVVGFGAS